MPLDTWAGLISKRRILGTVWVDSGCRRQASDPFWAFFDSERSPDGGVITGSWTHPWSCIHRAFDGCLDQWLGYHDVVDAPAEVSFEALGEAVIPEGKLLFLGVMFAE